MLFVIPVLANEGFTNMPLAGNTNAYNWYSLGSNDTPAIQLWNATEERVSAHRSVWRTPPPTLDQSFWVGIANTNLVVTNIVGTSTNIYTNVFTVVSNVLRTVYPTLYPSTSYYATNNNATNNIGPFEYVYMDDTNLLTNTAYPNLDYSLIWFMGQSLFSGRGQVQTVLSLDSYAVMNLHDGTSFNDYFSRTANDGSHPDDLPLQSKAGLFYRAGIGCTFDRTTNDWEVVTGGKGYMTRQPLMDSVWWLNESHLATAGGTTWTKDFSSTFSTGHTNESQLPLLFYTPGSVTTTDSFDVVLSGLALLLDPSIYGPSTWVTTQEVVTIDNRSVTQEVELVYRWYSFTTITNSATNLTADSTVTVRYEGEIIIFDINQYGGPTDYRLYQVNIDEFYLAMTNMIASKAESWDTLETEAGLSVTQGIYQWQGFSWAVAETNVYTYTTNLPGTIYAWAATTTVEPDYLVDHYTYLQDNVTVTNDSATKPDWRYQVDVASTGTFTIVSIDASGDYFIKMWIEDSLSGFFSNVTAVSSGLTYEVSTDWNSDYVLKAGMVNEMYFDFDSGFLTGGGDISITNNVGADTIYHISGEILAERCIANLVPIMNQYSQGYWTNRTTGRELYLQGAIYPTQHHFQAYTPLSLLNFDWSAEPSVADLITNQYVQIWTIAETLGSTGGVCNVGSTNTFSDIPFNGQTNFEERGWWMSIDAEPLWLIKHDIEGTNRGFDYW